MKLFLLLIIGLVIRNSMCFKSISKRIPTIIHCTNTDDIQNKNRIERIEFDKLIKKLLVGHDDVHIENLTVNDETMYNISLAFKKYELLQKIDSVMVSEAEKIELIDTYNDNYNDNHVTSIRKFNIHAGGLYNDWDFSM